MDTDAESVHFTRKNNNKSSNHKDFNSIFKIISALAE